jgi:hypothetical protein
LGLADFKARLLLFFARKLREWANSIDENVPPPRQPGSVVAGEPQPSTRIAGGPPQHWIDLVRERAPELLSLTQGYSSEERSLPEDHVHTYQSETDDETYRSATEGEMKVPGQRVINLPRPNEGAVRKSEPVVLPPKKVVDKRNARTKAKSFLPGSKPLVLKPVSEPSPFLQRSVHDSDQRTAAVEPPQSIEVFERDEQIAASIFEREEQIVASTDQSSRGAVKEKLVVTRESAQQPSPRKSRSDEAPTIYRAPKTRATTVSAAKSQAPTEVDATRKLEVQKSSSKVGRKTRFGPRRYVQAILAVTRKTLRRTARALVDPSRTIKPNNVSVNSSKYPSSTSNVVSFAEPSKAQRLIEHETSSTFITERGEKKTVTVVYPLLKAPESATRQVSPPIHPRASVKNVKSASRQPTPVAFPRPVTRFPDASNVRIQESFVNMPALMDEDRMNRASSVHLADLRPGKNQWPDLPSETPTEVADEWAAHQRDLNRMRRLKQEQRGSPWNE